MGPCLYVSTKLNLQETTVWGASSTNHVDQIPMCDLPRSIPLLLQDILILSKRRRRLPREQQPPPKMSGRVVCHGES